MQQSAFKQQQYNKYNGHWKTDLIGAICADPCYCCVAIFCPPCVSYNVRQRVLYNDMSRYTCCNNDCPCSGRMNEQACPQVCLALEVCFCFAQSVASSRWAIQDEQHIQNTACDNCIIGTMIVAQYVACICNIAACLSGSSELGAIADVADSIAHILWITPRNSKQSRRQAKEATQCTLSRMCPPQGKVIHHKAIHNRDILKDHRRRHSASNILHRGIQGMSR